MTFEDRVVRHIRERLAKINQSIADCEQHLALIKPQADYYLTMQSTILASSEAMEAWQAFMITVQLTVNDTIPGITHREQHYV